MLGRLEMDVDQCISAYITLVSAVFDDRSSFLSRVSFRRGMFDSKKLKDALEAIVISQGLSPADRFNDGKSRGCKV